jgi:hypothetical protein
MDMIQGKVKLIENGAYESPGKKSTLPGFNEVVQIALHSPEGKMMLSILQSIKVIIQKNNIWVEWNVTQCLERT